MPNVDVVDNLQPMKGGNFYNENAAWQHRAMVEALPLLIAAAEAAPLPADRHTPFNVAEFACSQV